ncbi:MAG: hypothetical protein JWQ71_3997 [Pedosphaera sp.]|nr:hypothetical protein [Pedosphaera sp.]
MIRRYLFCLACLATLIAIFYAEENWRGRHAWKRYQREAETRGETLDWKAFLPPAMPDDQNFALASFFDDSLLRWQQNTNPAVTYDTNRIEGLNLNIFIPNLVGTIKQTDLPTVSNWKLGKKIDLKNWQEYYRRPRHSTTPKPETNQFPIPFPPKSPAADVLFVLGTYSNVFQEFRLAAQRPSARFPINYEDTFGALLPHLAKLKQTSQYLELLAEAELEAGHSLQAAEYLDLTFYLTESIKSESTLVSQLVRLAMFDIALSSIWGGMADHRWTEAQLHHFQEKMESMDFLADFRMGIAAERAMDVKMLDDLNSARSGTFMALDIRFVPSGWFDRNKLVCAELLQEKLLTAIQPKTQRVDLKLADSMEQDPRLTNTSPYLVSMASPYNVFARFLLPSLPKIVQKAARGQTSVNLATIACALERYQLAHGAYPKTLEPLVPQFLSKLPHEITNGEPLKYRRSEDGRFVLYSIGSDGKDDGGAYPSKEGVDFQDNKFGSEVTGDWVWRYPSK